MIHIVLVPLKRHKSNEEFEKATEAYTKAVSIDSTGNVYLFNRGILLIDLKRKIIDCNDFEKAYKLGHPVRCVNRKKHRFFDLSKLK